MSKPGFEHHGPWTSVTARKMLSARGGRNAQKTLRAQGYKHLIAASAKGRLTRSRNAISSHVFKLDAQCARVYGCTLLEYLLTRGSDIDSDS